MNSQFTQSNEKNAANDVGGAPTPGLAITLAPTIPVYTASGEYAGPLGSGYSDRNNPLLMQYLNRWDNSKKIALYGNVFTEIDILKGLTFRNSIGVDFNDFSRKDIEPIVKNGFVNFKSTIDKKIIDKVSLNNKMRNERFYKKNIKISLVSEHYCGPINRVKIKYKNQKELTFNYSEYKTDLKYKEIIQLQEIIKNNYLEKRFDIIKNPYRLEKKFKYFKKYSLNKDTLELPFPPMPMPPKKIIKFIK